MIRHQAIQPPKRRHRRAYQCAPILRRRQFLFHCAANIVPAALLDQRPSLRDPILDVAHREHRDHRREFHDRENFRVAEVGSHGRTWAGDATL